MIERLGLPYPETAEDIISLQIQAYTHPLTGLLNRLAFQRVLTRLKPGSIIMIVDVDNLKILNLSLGHFEADKVLVAISEVLRSRLKRKTDICFHFGGDEFAVIMESSKLDYALQIAEEIGLCVCFIDAPVACSVSIGISVFNPGSFLETALENADRALYEAKARGKNQVICWGDISEPYPLSPNA